MGTTPRAAICQYMGWEHGEALDYRYRYGRTGQPVYSMPDGFVCATKRGALPRSTDGFCWVKATGSTAAYLAASGVTIWVSKE